MHFLIFMYLLVMILISFVIVCKVFVAFVEDIGCRRWKWVPLHLVTGTTVTIILLHFVGQMVKFVNA